MKIVAKNLYQNMAAPYIQRCSTRYFNKPAVAGIDEVLGVELQADDTSMTLAITCTHPKEAEYQSKAKKIIFGPNIRQGLLYEELAQKNQFFLVFPKSFFYFFFYTIPNEDFLAYVSYFVYTYIT